MYCKNMFSQHWIISGKMAVKLVGFDWDGTLAKMPVKYSWSLISIGLNCTEKMKTLRDKFNKKEIDYETWCELCVNTYEEFSLTEKKFYEIVEENVTLHDGTVETINELRSRGIKVGIISGGIYNIYEQVSKKFGLEVDYVNFTATLDFDENGRLTGGKYNSYDYEGKLDMFKLYCKWTNATLHEALFVGDSYNDISVFKATNGIAFSSDSEDLKKYAKYVIKGDNMKELLDYVT